MIPTGVAKKETCICPASVSSTPTASPISASETWTIAASHWISPFERIRRTAAAAG